LKRAILAALCALLAPTGAFAEQQGIYDVARPEAGCGCHAFGPYSLPPSPTQVRLFIDDQPLEVFAGYHPGQDHKLTVWVIGLLPAAGFNLEASAGTLSPVDAAVSKTVNLTECGRMERQTGCAGEACQVKLDDGCPVFDTRNFACQRCLFNQLGTEACRECDAGSIVDVQATHATANQLPYFELTWTAPAEPVDVEIHLAGNKAPGLGGNLATAVAFWNFADPNPIVLHPAPY
jgi:hypothetical protein